MNNSITKKTAQTMTMPVKTKWNVLSNIKTICDSIVESQLSPERTTLYQTTILRLNEYFNTTDKHIKSHIKGLVERSVEFDKLKEQPNQ